MTASPMTSTGTTDTILRPAGTDLIRRRMLSFFEMEDPRWVAGGYLLLLMLAEVLTVFVSVQIGVLLHLAILFLILLHAAARWERPLHRFLLSLALIPLIRVVSLALPLFTFPLVYWYFFTSAPLFVATLLVIRLLDFSWRDALLQERGMGAGGWLLQLAMGLVGVGLGYLEYQILRPEPMAPAFNLQVIWLPALIFLISTGYLEELIFRRVLQRTAIERLGAVGGVLYVAMLFAVLHIGYKSAADVVFVFVVGLVFGWWVYRSGNLLGVTLAHGLTNICLFLVFPFFTGGQVPLS